MCDKTLQGFSELPAYLESALDTVFVEAVAPIGPAEVCAIDTADVTVAVAGGQALRVVNRMMIRHLFVDLIGIDGLGQIERDT